MMGRSRSPSPSTSMRRRKDKDREREKRTRKRSRDRDRDRPERRHRSRSRDRDRDRTSRDRERERVRRTRSRSYDRDRSGGAGSSSSKKSRSRRGAVKTAERPPITEADLEGKTPEEQEMMKAMGFCGFDTTKNKKVEANRSRSVNYLRNATQFYIKSKEIKILIWAYFEIDSFNQKFAKKLKKTRRLRRRF